MLGLRVGFVQETGMGQSVRSIRRPDAKKPIAAIKQQMRKRWSRYFDAFQAFTHKDTDQIVDDVIIDIDRGTIKWDYGPLEAVLAYWSHRRILGELKNAGLRREIAKKLNEPDGFWRSTLPSQDSVLTRTAVMQLCKGRERETQLAQMVLDDPGLIAGKNFRAEDIRKEFHDLGVKMTIGEVHALIERFRKLLRQLI